MARRSLKDLYVVGKLIEMTDESGGAPVTVWVQKLNPVEQQACVKKADAVKARVLTIGRDKESDDYQAVLSDVLAAEPEALVMILTALERGKVQPIVEAELADAEEWKADNYLTGLRDLWDDGLAQTYADDSEDADAVRVHAELDRFFTQVDDELDSKMEIFSEGLRSMSLQELQETMVESNIRSMADVAWMNEYYAQEVFHAVRSPDNKREREFESRQDIDELQVATYAALRTAMRELNVEPQEGKDSAGRPPSSTSSEPSDKEATANSSGQTAAAA